MCGSGKRGRADTVPLEELYGALNPTVTFAGYHRAAPGYRYVPDGARAPQFYFWYVAGGAGSIRVDGGWTTMSTGDFLILRPGERFEEERADADDPSRIYFSYIDPFGGPVPRLVVALKHRLPRRLTCPAQAQAATLFADLLETYAAGSGRRAVRLKILALEVLDLVFASLEVGTGSMAPHHREAVRRAREFIESHVTEPLTPEEIGRRAGVSASHLFVLFRRHVGRSPIRYQTELRLRAATRELLDGRSVTETARATGFASLHYFSRVFKKRYGTAPSQFVRMHPAQEEL